MHSEEIRRKFLEFFKTKGHKIIPSSSLIPDDPSVLLTTAGMQQFKRYFTGELDAEKDFGVKCIASIQKCFRTSDIDEVGDKSHLTFFEMLGHFSFGDYFKKETIDWTFKLLTDVFKIDPKRISARVFEGDEIIPFDRESFETWLKYLPEEKIHKGQRGDNFWGPVGNEGPCGAANEVYVDDIEVATLVFIEYYRDSEGSLKSLVQKGVDVGWGFERLAAILNKKENVFETDILQPLISKINEFCPDLDERVIRILADHLRASIFLIADSIRPSNKEAGYVLRRLLRRILAYRVKYDIHADLFLEAVEIVRNKFGEIYPELKNSREILEVLEEEQQKFQEVMSRGIKELENYKKFPHSQKYSKLDSKRAFYLYETFGLPFELIKELAPEEAVKNLSKEDFDKEFKKHQEISRAGAEKKFGGHGLLLDTGELKATTEEEIKKVIRLHTATHLFHWALREVLGEDVRQMGSDINSERLRFDFSFNRKMTPEEVKKIENLVNEKIKEDLPVYFKEMPRKEAEKTGALHFFKQKYPDIVKVYFICPISAEFCGGPHVGHTGEIGKFKIIKEEAVGAGARRIRAALD